ncbi:MAG: hypothetical protein ACN4GZ_00260 [Acidimicrobiales bacterium]
MATTKRAKIASTDKTTNLDVPVTGELSLDEMETVLLDAATELGMHFSRVTVLGTKQYPGNRHWHLKQDPRAVGCLDVTYWPAGPLMWISMRNYEPEWVHDVGHRLGAELERRLT